jgi:hypothetical protein
MQVLDLCAALENFQCPSSVGSRSLMLRKLIRKYSSGPILEEKGRQGKGRNQDRAERRWSTIYQQKFYLSP